MATPKKEGMELTIEQIVRILRKEQIDYDQSKYLFKKVREALGLRPPRGRSKSQAVKRLASAELEAFMDQARRSSASRLLMMKTLYEGAFRVNEFTSLMATDIRLDECIIVVREGKGDKRREVPITPELANMLALHLKERKHGPLFPAPSGKPYSDRRIQQIVSDLAALASIDMKVTPHTLRHTRATVMAEAGMPKDLIQGFLGHEKPETTEIYTRTAALPLKKEFKKIFGKK